MVMVLLLTPRESASEFLLDEPLGLFRYLPRSGLALLAGTLPLQYCAARFACRTPTWRLPVSGHVDVLLPLVLVGRLMLMVLIGRFTGLVVLDLGGKEFDCTEKPLHTSQGSWFNLVQEFGRGCVMWDFPVFPFLITRGGRGDQDDGGLGLDISLGLCRPTSPGLHRFQVARSWMQD